MREAVREGADLERTMPTTADERMSTTAGRRERECVCGGEGADLERTMSTTADERMSTTAGR